MDLKAAATASTDSKTYNLGSEEATRLIAAKINTRRAYQIGPRGRTRYLRARYVRMSGKPSYSGNPTVAGPADANALGLTQAQTLRVKFNGGYRNGFPSDLPTSGTITYDDNNNNNITLSYSAITGSKYGPKRFASSASSQESFADFDMGSALGGNPGGLLGASSNGVYPTDLSSLGATFTIAGEPEKHTVVLSFINSHMVSHSETDGRRQHGPPCT